MAYSPQTWHDLPTADTSLSAARFAHIESGIQTAAAHADTLDTSKENTGVAATVAASAVTAHVAQADPHTQYLNAARAGGAAYLSVGTVAATVAAGDDSRIVGAAQATDMTTALAGKANTVHQHAGADITSGTVPYARLPVGTTASTVAAGNDTRITNDRAAVDVQALTANGTWTKPAGALRVDVICIGAGGGGGSGAREPSGTVSTGGAGGGGGGMVSMTYAPAQLGATENVWVGAAGAGGASVTTNATVGNSGTGGGTSAFGGASAAAGRIKAPGGSGGAGGSTAAATAGPGAAGYVAGSAGGASVLNAAGAAAVAAAGAAGGGGGGSLATTPVSLAGGAGAAPLTSAGTTAGAAGSAGGAGGAATSATDTTLAYLGASGGGGGSSSSAAAGAGGVGANYGGGGGGGGGSLNGFASGAGGAGAGGLVFVVTTRTAT